MILQAFIGQIKKKKKFSFSYKIGNFITKKINLEFGILTIFFRYLAQL